MTGYMLGANNLAIRRSIHDLVSALGFASPRGYIDSGEMAYQNGKYAAALRVLRPLAEKGDPRAQSLVGLMYYHGRGLKQDDSQAAKWFRLAADQGEARAQFNLGVMHAEGQGVPQDNAEALRWYRLAANQGEARAQFNLGVSYAEGHGVEQDYVLAYMWFNLAVPRFLPSESDRRQAAIYNRDLTASKMSREEIAEAQRLAREWKPQ
jgi:TPR repeat protein